MGVISTPTTNMLYVIRRLYKPRSSSRSRNKKRMANQRKNW